MKLDELMGRRSELMAELFLQDLGPKFVAKAPNDFGFDFIVGFQFPLKSLRDWLELPKLNHWKVRALKAH